MYKGFRLPDLPQSDIYQHFRESAEFLDRALSFTHGLVTNQLSQLLCLSITVLIHPKIKVITIKVWFESRHHPVVHQN